MEQATLSNLIGQLVKEKEQYLRRGLELAQHPFQSAEVDKVYAAFSKAQGAFTAIIKNTKGYNYRYAELSDILEMVRPILAKYGLHLSQYMSSKTTMHTRIGHDSGQWFASQWEVPMPQEGTTQTKMSFMQELGSRRTYARRYEVLSILGLQPQGEDNDAALLPQKR